MPLQSYARPETGIEEEVAVAIPQGLIYFIFIWRSFYANGQKRVYPVDFSPKTEVRNLSYHTNSQIHQYTSFRFYSDLGFLGQDRA